MPNYKEIYLDKNFKFNLQSKKFHSDLQMFIQCALYKVNKTLKKADNASYLTGIVLGVLP